MSLTPPYLSIVITARNDNYGGDFNVRLQNSVNWLWYFVEKYHLPCELLIVDYNPVAENPLLAKMLQWPKGKHLSIRLIHVSNRVHQKLINPEIRKTVPLFEFNAKNMAVRRAKGEYILCTNADIIFHPSIIGFLAQKSLSKKKYYRADRFDFRKIEAYNLQNPDNTLAQIQQNVYRLMLRGKAYNVEPAGFTFFKEHLVRLKNAYSQLMFYKQDIKEKIAHYFNQTYVRYDAFALKYHTHCSGDFMLMHRDHWFKLRGYTENTYISTHTDALFTVMTDIYGLKEDLLPWPVYHQEHERRYNTDFKEIPNNKNVSGHEKDMEDMFDRFIRNSREMEKTRKPIIVNDVDWGMAGEVFEETVI